MSNSEEWFDVPGFQRRYQASNLGRVREVFEKSDQQPKVLDSAPKGDVPRGITLEVRGEPRIFDVRDVVNDTLENAAGTLKPSHRNRLLNSRKSVYRGVAWDYGKWVATIHIAGKPKYLGRFDEEEQAAQAYKKEALRIGRPAYSKKTIDHSQIDSIPSPSLELPEQKKYPGIFWDKASGRWRAIATINSKTQHVGMYRTQREAHEARGAYIANQPRSHRSTSKGVSYSKQSGRWKAYISISGKQTYLGSFDTEEEAARAYKEAAELVGRSSVKKRPMKRNKRKNR